jgi:hypothetical protein
MTNNLDLSQVAAAQNQKEVTINDQAGQIDAALTEQVTADVSAGNATVSAAAYRRAIYIKATGAATGGRTVTLPAIKRFVAIANTSTTHSVHFILGSATITLAAAASATAPTIAVVYTDGTANGLYVVTGTTGSVVSAFTDLTDVPASYTSQALKVLRVNAGATALEFVALTLALNSDFPASYAGAGGFMLRVNAGATAVAFEAIPFLVSLFIPGTFGNGALMAQLVFDRNVSFPNHLTGSQGYAQTNATSSTVLDLHKNGAPVGTITFTNAGSTATFALSGGATFAAGDRLAIYNENPADATLADLSITLRGTRT